MWNTLFIHQSESESDKILPFLTTSPGPSAADFLSPGSADFFLKLTALPAAAPAAAAAMDEADVDAAEALALAGPAFFSEESP